MKNQLRGSKHSKPMATCGKKIAENTVREIMNAVVSTNRKNEQEIMAICSRPACMEISRTPTQTLPSAQNYNG